MDYITTQAILVYVSRMGTRENGGSKERGGCTARARKFSAVLGTSSPYRPMTMRPREGRGEGSECQ